MATTVLGNLAVIPQMKWINLNKAKKSLQLPDPWPALIAAAFHQDIVDGHMRILRIARNTAV